MQTEYKQHANKGMVTVFYPVPTVLRISVHGYKICIHYTEAKFLKKCK